MAITMGYLYEKSMHLYDMQIVAGKKGLDRTVEWIHLIELSESASFLHGNEIVFFTGIVYQGADWLLDFTKKLKNRNCSGFVINAGPYIKKIPQSVIAYCDENDLPLFILPWSVHLVDVTRYLCRFIIDEEKKKQSILNYLQQVLLLPEDSQAPCLSLEHHGFNVKGEFRVITLSAACVQQDYDEILALLKIWNSKMLTFYLHGKIIIVAVEKQVQNIKNECEEIYRFLTDKGIQVYISVGAQVFHVDQLFCSYRQAESINGLAKNKIPPIIFYDDMGVYKLLLNGTPIKVLKDFYRDTLGVLEEYDEAHKSNLMETLRYYMDHDCSIKETAFHEVVHRNTILYKFNKIEQILGKSVYEEEHKLAICMAFKVKELL